MRVAIQPVTVDGHTCVEAEVSVAVSNSVALRAVPVGPDGTEYPDAAIPVVGMSDHADVAAFLSVVSEASRVLLEGRGF